LPNIEPFLIVKKEQARLILQAVKLLSKHRPYHTQNDGKLRELYLKLHKLNLAKNARGISPWIKNE
jgi:hypothetical protein